MTEVPMKWKCIIIPISQPYPLSFNVRDIKNVFVSSMDPAMVIRPLLFKVTLKCMFFEQISETFFASTQK